MRNIRTFMMMMAAVLLSGMRDPAMAQYYVNVDFQPGGSGGGTSVAFAAQGALPTPGNTWNVVAPSTDGINNNEFGSGGRFDFSGDPFYAGSLISSTGGFTSVGVEIFKGDPDGGYALNPLNGFEVNLADDARDLMRDYMVSGWDTDPNALNIVGLYPGSSYVLYLYGAGDNDAVSTKFTVNGAVQATTGVPGGSHNLTLGEDYVVFTGVATSGTIVIQYEDNGETSDGHFNGFQLYCTPASAIPTLSEWAMIILVALVIGVGWFKLRARPVGARTA